ncbi:MAG TPA: PIN domain-containing protein [Amycolatopsis sp.]|uniref:type II toxin-antitoxin system VapC family toxin n=1 Tax=Amycolatopsis sp. TaxID=37632 RepID=UPI002B4911C7|nr:PIN domain-containing protein [Amycolatopsis sp.]HJQ45773.1 PIN domain-containing protein [Amycolatopsis sp.]HKS45453.1 PIN domain-containing protein [Amycolatopsis sp.]
MVICDTGPLAAAAIRRDPDYYRCTELFTGLHLANRPLIIPSPIIAEVGYFLARLGSAQIEAGFLRSVADGLFVATDLTSADYNRMADLVEQYADLPLGTSDAAVIAVAERLDIDEVATLDVRHFTVVRPRHVKAFTLLP